MPDPILLLDAAQLLGRHAVGYSAAEVYQGLIAAFWRGQFEAVRRSAVYTLEPVRQRYASEQGQKPAEILASPPRGVWVADDGAVYAERADGSSAPGRCRRVRWTRREVLRSLVLGDRNLALPAVIGREAAYRHLAETPLHAWSAYARALFFDRLCISLADLARWMAGQGDPMPHWLLGHTPDRTPQSAAQRSSIAAETACRKWLVSLMRAGPRQPKATLWDEAHERWPGLSHRGYLRVWEWALNASDGLWGRAGRPRKSNHRAKNS